MKEGLRRFYSGDFNTMNQQWQSDGSVVITLSKDDENKAYRFKVTDLYGEHEEVLEDEVIDTRPPTYIEARMKEAKKHGSKGST